MTNNGWLQVLSKRASRSKLRIFCFPYAGGSSAVFRPWVEELDLDAEIVAVELPGRGMRMTEAPISELSSVVSELARFSRSISERPYVFFGHSLGARIAYRLAAKLEEAGYPSPSHLFVSASPAAHLTGGVPSIFDLPDAQFLKELEMLDGTPKEILEDEELMSFMMPMLRADFKMASEMTVNDVKLHCPLTAICGSEDASIDWSDFEGWSELTYLESDLRIINGGHFYINSDRKELFAIIKEKILASDGTDRF